MNHPHLRRLSRAFTVTVAAAGLVVGTLPTAQAMPTRDRDGTTRVAVAPAVVRKLDRLGLEAAATKYSRAVPFRGTVAFRFPVKGVEKNGNIIMHRGGARISSPDDAIALKRFTIKLRQGKVGAAVVVNGDRVGRPRSSTSASQAGRPWEMSASPSRTPRRAPSTPPSAPPRFHAGDTFGFATVTLR